MNDLRQTLLERRRIIVEKAVLRMLPKLRILNVTGGLLVVVGSLALAASLFSRQTSLIPIGILMVVGSLFEMGVGHIARDPEEENAPATPWIVSGMSQFVAGVVVMFSPLLPSWLLTTLLGLLLTLAGLTWLRAGFALPERFQSAVVPLCGGITACIGLLIVSRWTGTNDNLLAIVLGCEMLIRGWSWFGFALGLTKAMKQ